MDKLDSEERSRLMSRIRAKDTRPEVALRKAIWAEGIRYRLHVRTLPGTPDMVHTRSRTAVFVDGCFWHGCPKHYNQPRNNFQYWERKLQRNLARREEVLRNLKSRGWRAVEVWECDVRNRLPKVTRTVIRSLTRGERGV